MAKGFLKPKTEHSVPLPCSPLAVLRQYCEKNFNGGSIFRVTDPTLDFGGGGIGQGAVLL